MTTTPGLQSGIARRWQRCASAVMMGIIGLSWLTCSRLVTAQDAIGRMWFATRGGFVIYDGLRWQVIDRPETPPGASSQHLAADGRGFMWLTTSDPRNLITAFKSDSWSDMVMPQMGGRLLTEHLRSAQPHLRIVFMSGYAGDDHLDVTTMAEGAEFLHKPFSPTLLTTTVRNLLDASG